MQHTANAEAKTVRSDVETEPVARLEVKMKRTDVAGADADASHPLLLNRFHPLLLNQRHPLLLSQRPHPLLLHLDLAPSLFFSSTDGQAHEEEACEGGMAA
jgi:hypothetical protein